MAEILPIRRKTLSYQSTYVIIFIFTKMFVKNWWKIKFKTTKLSTRFWGFFFFWCFFFWYRITSRVEKCCMKSRGVSQGFVFQTKCWHLDSSVPFWLIFLFVMLKFRLEGEEDRKLFFLFAEFQAKKRLMWRMAAICTL